MSEKKTRRKSSPEKVYPKCIYCQTELTKGKSSKEHVVNQSILPKYNNKLTLLRKVCKECNEGFAEIDIAFVESTITGLNKIVMDKVNDEDRWNDTQEPFLIKNISTTIRGDKQTFTVETNEEHEKNVFRGIAKIALNALIYDLRGKKSEFRIDKHGNRHYACARNDDIFSGDEEELSDIKKFIKEGGKSRVHIARKRIPLRIFDKNMGTQGQEIPMQNVTDPIHTIVICKDQSYYYAVISLFIGLDETPPLYFVPLIGDMNDIDTNCPDREMVRIYNFGYLVKKEPQQESVTSRTIGIPEGNSAYVITPVDDPELIYPINTSKNNSALLKKIQLEYQRRT